MSIWQSISKPIFALAPMEDVTDSVFRQIVVQTGKPDLFFTEFTSVDAILSPGFKNISNRLIFTKSERPIIAQIWGNDPEKFYKVAKMLQKMGFDGIDINMGCPDKSVVKHGSCSALIKNPNLAIDIIKATKKGAGSAGRRIPVSVKTRIGFYNINEMETWVTTLLSQDIAALTLHLRTVKEMSKVPAHWELIQRAVEIRDNLKVKTKILGNGDIKSMSEAQEKIDLYGIDGVMIGRGIFENLWFFNPQIKPEDVSVEKKLKLLIKHANLFYKTWGNTKNFAILKKFFKCYINGFPNASELRMKLMEAENPAQIKKIILKNSTLLLNFS